MWTGGGRRRWTCPIHLPYVCFHFGRINAFSGVDICLRFTRLICILIVYQRIIISLLVHDTQIHHCIQNICRFCWITQTTHRKLSNPLIKNILLSSNLQILFAVHWNLMRKQLTIRALTLSLSILRKRFRLHENGHRALSTVTATCSVCFSCGKLNAL